MKKSSWKKNKTAPKQKQPQLVTSPAAFEAAFENRIGMSPKEWIRAKIENGSTKEDIEYLYELCVAETERQSNCMSQPLGLSFDPAWKEKEKKPMSKIMKTTYNKLVRDRIPEIIEADGKRCICETLPQEHYLAMLDAKLNEELSEYQQSKSLEELADLLEVMGAVVKARGHTWEELTTIRKKKLEVRGGFEKRILLKEVYEDAPAQAAQKQAPSNITPQRNAGKPWTEAEDNKLKDEFDSKMPIKAIAKEHGRTVGAIESRLVRLGKLTKKED